MRALSVLVLSCCLVGCTAAPAGPSLWSRASGVTDPVLYEQAERLLDQPRIDPLTRFLEQYAAQHASDPNYQHILRERNSRCRAIGTRYARHSPTDENLALLRSGYQYSCPDIVSAFAERVALSPTAKPPSPKATPSALSARERRQANSCYLLFAIKNYQQALPVCTEVAESGDPKAQHHLGSILQVNHEFAQALHWARRSAAQQHPPGQLLLAQLYQRSDGSASDKNNILELIEAAAEQGLAAAQYEAGLAYLHGTGTTADQTAAQRWLERAAGQDHLPAQLQLADLHLNDPGAGQASARQWLLRAASLGSVTAQYRLGASYMDGIGGAPDYTEAYIWLSQALLNGEPRAEPRVQALAGLLTPEQTHIARQRIDAGLSGRLP